jgi:galactokinase
MHVIPLKIEKKFYQLFGESPVLVRSPGRVNLIGEHTDYNEGFVLPAAVDKAIYFAISPRSDNLCVLHAVDLRDSYQFRLGTLKKTVKRWPDYLLGVVDQLQQKGYLFKGFNCVFGGDIPIGAGMSSSAALEAGLAYALNDLFQLNIDSMTLVKLAQKAENEFVGVQCGIMDQLINIYGQDNQVLRLDCRSLEYEYYPFESDRIKIVLCDTQVQRELGSSEYNNRRAQCEQGIKILQKNNLAVKNLRDVSLSMLREYKKQIDPVVYRRCKYVIEENERVLAACENLVGGNFKEFGQKMYQSHQGLQQEYEVSCRELDLLVEAASQHKGVIGARMMGAGFGGCTINLVWKEQLESFEEKMEKTYQDKLKKKSTLYITEITAGTAILKEKVVND